MAEQTYRIGEAARLLELQTYVLRFWETEFPQLVPLRTPKGQRLYTEANVDLLRRIQRLLYEQGLTIEGARRVLDGAPEPGIGQGHHPIPADNLPSSFQYGAQFSAQAASNEASPNSLTAAQSSVKASQTACLAGSQGTLHTVGQGPVCAQGFLLAPMENARTEEQCRQLADQKSILEDELCYVRDELKALRELLRRENHS